MEDSQQDIEMNSSCVMDRKMRLKNLINEGVELDHGMSQKSPEYCLNQVKRIICSSDTIISEGDVRDRATSTTEVVLDAHLLKLNHELVTKVMQQSEDFSSHVYQTAISGLVFKSAETNWSAIAEIVCKIANTARVKSSMLGAIELQPKERVVKERQKRAKTKLTEEIRPESLDKLEREDEGDKKLNLVHKQIVQIYKKNGCRPIPFFKLIIDPSNFSQTVENALHLSFLVRDNIIAISRGSDGMAEVRLATNEEKNEEKENVQAICTLNPPICHAMMQFYNITEPMLKLPRHANKSDDEPSTSSGIH